MAVHASSHPQNQKVSGDSVRNSKPDSSAKLANSDMVHSKEVSLLDVTSCVSSVEDATNSVQGSDVNHGSLTTEHESYITEPNILYPGNTYHGGSFPGYDGYFGELGDRGYPLAGSDGLETQCSAMQADTGSLIYFTPGYHPGLHPYAPYIPVAVVGVNGQFITHPMYMQNPMLQSHIASTGYFSTSAPYGSELIPSSYLYDPSLFVGDGGQSGGLTKISDTLPVKANISAQSQPAAVAPSKFHSTSEFSKSSESNACSELLGVSSSHGMLSELAPANKAFQHVRTLQSDDVLAKGYGPIATHSSYDQANSKVFYPKAPVDTKVNGKGWSGTEMSSTTKTNGITDSGLIKEKNHGSKTTNFKGVLVSGGKTVGAALASEENGFKTSMVSIIRRDQYNLPHFQTEYDHALFFVIKSYSEDDVHKSIKYNVWASTPNGNRRLDSAFQNAQGMLEERGSKCPVFLFFSVNASGQFCGVAEMIGRVDFTKSMEFWQQDKWNGSFPVKWHIIKDVPNPQLRHIILENNESKPVTNSRDTQEVRFPQGIEMLNFFKNFVSKTSILDDFNFYESRQQVMQDKRMRSSMPHCNYQQKVAEVVAMVESISLTAGEIVEEPETGKSLTKE